MTARGLTYAKRPCRGCGHPTSARLQIRVRAIGEDRRDGPTLASQTATLCDQCALGLYADYADRLYELGAVAQ